MKTQALIVMLAGLALISSENGFAGGARFAAPGGFGQQLSGTATAVSLAPLSSLEQQDLAFMREEEKLARDVYLTLFERWGLTPFSNISSGEQQHMDTMLRLLRTYGLPDPASSLAIGEFTNTNLQALYDTLIEHGLQSDINALQVGGNIEETDILDLTNVMERTDHADLAFAYSNLQCGSRNHLRAFAQLFTAITGQPYLAQVMSQEAVDAILATRRERCGR